MPIVFGHEAGAFGGSQFFAGGRCANLLKVCGQNRGVADCKIAGARYSDLPMRGDVAQDHRKTVACGLKHRDRLTLEAGRQHEAAGVRIEFAERRSGLVSQQNHAGSFSRGLRHLARIRAGIIRGADQCELPVRHPQARISGDEVELAFVLVDPGDHQHVTVRRKAECLQNFGRANAVRPVDAVWDRADRHPVGARQSFCQTVRDGDAAVGKRHSRPFPEPQDRAREAAPFFMFVVAAVAGHHDPQSQRAGERRKECRSDGMDVQDVGSIEGGPQHAQEGMNESLDAGAARGPDARELDAAPPRGSSFCDVAAAHDCFHVAAEAGERTRQLFGVLFRPTLHIGKAAYAQHGHAQGAPPQPFDLPWVRDLVHRTRTPRESYRPSWRSR